MNRPDPCRECAGGGWLPYSVEAEDGTEEWAWRLCPCGDGKWLFPNEMLDGEPPRDQVRR